MGSSVKEMKTSEEIEKVLMNLPIPTYPVEDP